MGQGGIRISVEASSTMGWHKYLRGEEDLAIGMPDFEYGLSGPGSKVLEKFGFTPENIILKVLDHIKDQIQDSP